MGLFGFGKKKKEDTKKSNERISFHNLTVSDIRREAKNTISIAFEIPEDKKDIFRFIHGQYITIKTSLNGEELRRSYSICSSPYEDDFRIAVKKVKEGRVSSYLNDKLKVGDTLPVMPPMGKFYTELNLANQKTYIFFAGGSGITPVISIIKAILHKEPESKIELYYGNSVVADIIFNDQLEHLKEKYVGRLKVYHYISRESGKYQEGRINPNIVKEAIKDTNGKSREFFICGPEKMMQTTQSTLLDEGIHEENIHLEFFTAPEEGVKEVKDKKKETTGMSKVTIILDDETFSINLSKNGSTILNAALDEGYDVPFSCKGAVCCTCRARVTSGKAEMEMNYALTDKEVEEGYILTCQSHPLTDEITVDYDQN